MMEGMGAENVQQRQAPPHRVGLVKRTDLARVSTH